AGLLGGPVRRAHRGPVVIVSSLAGRYAFRVDGLLGQRDLVVKGLGRLLPRIGLLAGASVEPDGSVLLVLDAAGLVEQARPGPRRGCRRLPDQERVRRDRAAGGGRAHPRSRPHQGAGRVTVPRVLLVAPDAERAGLVHALGADRTVKVVGHTAAPADVTGLIE